MVLGIFGQVDRGHAAFAQDPLHLILTGEGLPDARDLTQLGGTGPGRNVGIGRSCRSAPQAKEGVIRQRR